MITDRRMSIDDEDEHQAEDVLTQEAETSGLQSHHSERESQNTELRNHTNNNELGTSNLASGWSSPHINMLLGFNRLFLLFTS